VNSFWIRRLLIKDGFASNCEKNLFYDNKVTILIFHYHVKHDYIKYIEGDRHFIMHKLFKFFFVFLLKLTLKIVIIIWSINHAMHQKNSWFVYKKKAYIR